MALHLLESEDIRTSCRKRLESCELWLRRLVHGIFLSTFGENYIETAALNGQQAFKKEIRERVHSKLSKSAGRFARPVDALLLDDLVHVIGKEDFYKEYFASAFSHRFPLGRTQIRLYLERLVPIRNALSHANHFSNRDAEIVLCYCGEIIKSLEIYYKGLGMEKEFNAPTITKISDSEGGFLQLSGRLGEKIDLRKQILLRSGMSLSCEIEVDAHYDSSEYRIEWSVIPGNGERAEGRSFRLDLSPCHVGETLLLQVRVISNKEWHRFSLFDDEVILMYRVLPPI